MYNKKTVIKTSYRFIFLAILEFLIYRNEKIDVFFSAISVTAIAIWVLPALFTKLTMLIFKVKEEYGGTLQYDDTDITNCRFRMIFTFEPEELIKNEEFAIKVERANLLFENRDQNKG